MSKDTRRTDQRAVQKREHGDQAGAPAPGKVSRSGGLPSRSRPVQAKSSESQGPQVKSAWEWTMDPWMDAAIRGTPPPSRDAAVQGKGAVAQDADQVHSAAAQGVQGGGSALPHLDRIQAAFGAAHDLGGVRAHVGGGAADACAQIGAEAYATGDSVAFQGTPDLHTAAHEAAHVVQQRHGVQLAGGVGQAGDHYEQQADQVADLVVRGESAEHLLGGGGAQGGAVQRRAVQKDGGDQQGDQAEPQSAYDALSPGEQRQVEDTLDAISSTYLHLLLRQRDAVNDLLDAVKEEEPPGFWDVVLKVAVEVALTAALGPIGTAIGAKIAKEGAKLGRQMIASAVSGGVTKAIEESIKSGYGAIFASIPGRDPKDKFFKSQRNTLVDVSQQTSNHFNVERKEQIRQSSDPLAEARALNRAVEASYQTAYEVQRNKTMDEWISYKARSEHGTYKDDKRTNMGAADLSDTSETGILGIEITTKETPPDPANPTIAITEINLGGVHSNLREVAKTRGTIGALRVPKSINGTVYGRAGIEFLGYPHGNLAIGLSEDGGFVWNESDDNGTRWLKMFSTGTVSPDPDVNDAIPKSEAFKGAEKLFQALSGSSISSLS